MSLVLAAKHLESHGRHGDTELVHMSKGEVKALRGLAQIHGGDLTINPKTGLPEAGFLSSILPTVLGVAGAAMGIPTPLLIGGIGLATAALTGDLGQGIMAGLGAWSGGKLGADIAEASTLAQTGADVGTKAFEATADSALKTTMEPFSETLGRGFTVDPTKEFLGQSFTPSSVSGIADQAKSFVPNISTGVTGFPQGTAAPSFSSAPSAWENFKSGATYAKENPIDFLSRPGVGLNTAMAVSPAILSAMEPNYNTAPKAAEDQNPFGFKKLSPDFKGTFGIRPSPYYQAQYTDYTKNPYIPKMLTSAGGGLQTTHYANRGLVQYGLGLLDQEQKPAPITPTDPGAAYSPAYNALGLSPYEKDTENMSSDKMAQSILKQAKALGKMASRASVMMPDPAKTAIASIQSDGQTPSAKEGGLQGYALGGLSLGHLGGYSDGGRLLKGPGDGVSDSIPASIGHKQPARLAEGEFVIPARIVSELGNGSTDAGAKRLYAMMDRIKAKRRKSKDIAADTKTYNYLPA